ncbi:MAG: hypothetical protein JNM60_10920 [Candidatus Competibacteraceae bacterium]|nr:hypothetical protein [Candidatus Competibacteraceae bacterium]
MVKPWINEDVFKSWTEAQKRLWDSLCSAVPFQPPAGIETWRETYLKNLTVWESAVKKTLSQEASWVRRWVKQVARENGAPEMMTTWVQQMEDVLQRWIQAQNQWWDDYFAVLRRGGELANAGREAKPGTATIKAMAGVIASPQKGEDEKKAGSKPEAVAPVAQAPGAAPKPPPKAATPIESPAASASAQAEAPTRPIAPPNPSQPDDLKAIIGIGPALERKLLAQGIISYRQLATMSEAQIDKLETNIKATGRIRRDDWIGQAKAHHLQKYREKL